MRYILALNKTLLFAKTACFLLLTAFMLTAAACSPRQQRQEHITIGALFPLTGEGADEGLRQLNGVQLAKEEINARGGILGRRLDIIVLNDRGCTEYIIKQYNRLIEKGVAAIIGSSYSVPTIALAMAAEKDGIPVISPTASDPIVTLGRQNVFRAIFTDDYQVKVMAYFAYNSLNARTAVVLGNQNFANYLQAAKYFNESFTAFGGHIMAFELFSSKDDFKRILKKYVANPPDIIFSPDNFVSAARLVNAVYEIGLVNTYILGTDAWDGILTYVSNLRAMERVYYTAPFSFDDQSEEVSRFVRNFFNRFAQMPLTGSANAYISVHILADAITKAESTDWADIVSAIREKEFDTITGRIQFDENNNPYISVYIIQIKGGEYSSLKKISLRERQ